MNFSRSPNTDRNFWNKVHPEPNCGCWLWSGSAALAGYGQLRLPGNKLVRATHYSLAIVGKDVPVGMFACHKCDNPPCVNPEHLFVGSQKENLADAKRKGRTSAPPRAYLGMNKKEFCLRGHAMEGDNLHWLPSGDRRCRMCERIRKKIRRARLNSHIEGAAQ